MFKLIKKNISGIIIILIPFIYAYLEWPPVAKIPSSEELINIKGYATFNVGSQKEGNTHFEVNKVRLNCSYKMLGNGGGCEFINNHIDKKKYVEITYYDLKGPFGITNHMLNSIEQDGKEIMSQKDTYSRLYKKYNKNILAIKKTTVFMFFLAILMVYLEKKYYTKFSD